MDVQYVQWDAHVDSRTRDTHIDLDGEITSINGHFSNGLSHPGDKNGVISEWIHCRCTLQPYLMPLGKKPPAGATYFREDDLVDVDTGFDITKYTLDDALNGNWGRNNIITVENNPVKVIDSNSWRFTEEDNLLIENLRAKNKELRKKLGLRIGQSGLSESENQQLAYLRDKKFFNRFYNEHLDSTLSYNDSKEIINLRKKHGWNVELNRSGLSPMSYERTINLTNRYGEVSSLSRKYRLTKSEEKELEDLLYKRLFNQGKLNSSDSLRLEFLYDKKQFNYLYSLNKQDKGINYRAYKEFQRLFNKLKTKLKLNKSILKQPLTGYKSKIKLNKKAKYFIGETGTTEDGLLPSGTPLDEIFTLDTRTLTERELEVSNRWLTSEYRLFTDFEKFNRNIEEYAKFILESTQGQYKYIETMEKALDKAKSIAHDVPILDDILNNQIKKNIMLFRVQENPHIGDNPKVGDVIEFINFRSTAISKEGALWFSKTNSKEMRYLLEIEAPAGTKGAYLAPILKGKFVEEMEFLLKKCKMEIVEMDKNVIKVEGEDLKVIKLRIIT